MDIIPSVDSRDAQQTATRSKHFHTRPGAPTWGELPLFPPKFERDSPCSNISWCSRHFLTQERRSFPAWIHSVSSLADLSLAKMPPLLTDRPWPHIWFRFWSRSHARRLTARVWWGQSGKFDRLYRQQDFQPHVWSTPQVKYPYSIARISMSSASAGVSLCVGSRNTTGA